MKNTQKLIISIKIPNKGFIKAGTLVIDEENKLSTFIYDKSYTKNNYPSINPASLNWKKDNNLIFITPSINNEFVDKTFWELVPSNNDWANVVLISRFPEFRYMNYAEKLSFLGSHTIGGIKVTLEKSSDETSVNGIEYLDKVREESVLLHQRDLETTKYYGAIKSLSSYSGSRPKCMFEDEGEFWLAKFNLPGDKHDMAINEKVALDIAQDVGLNTAASKILPLPSGEHVFLSKRFDKNDDDEFYSLSLYSLIPDDNHEKTGKIIYDLISTYSDFANVDTLQIIKKLLLDIGLNNTDNHLKNIRIILNNQQKWELAPFYDITLNPYEHQHSYLPINIDKNDLFLENPNISKMMSNMLNIDEGIIENEKQNIIKALNNWEQYCDKYNMNFSDKEIVSNAISIGLSKNKKKLTPKKTKELTLKHTINLPKLTPKN